MMIEDETIFEILAWSHGSWSLRNNDISDYDIIAKVIKLRSKFLTTYSLFTIHFYAVKKQGKHIISIEDIIVTLNQGYTSRKYDFI